MLNINDYLEYNDGFYYIKKWNINIIKNYLSLGCTLIGIFKSHAFNADVLEIKIFLVLSNRIENTYKLTSYGISNYRQKYYFVSEPNITDPDLRIRIKIDINEWY